MNIYAINLIPAVLSLGLNIQAIMVASGQGVARIPEGLSEYIHGFNKERAEQ